MTHFPVRGVVVALMVAGCGRFGFGTRIAPDATSDGAADASDAAPDASTQLPGLIGEWRMDDDPSDGVLDDSSGGGHPATCATGVSCPTSVAGLHGNAIRVNGAQYARVTYGAWLGTSGPFTYAAFVYVEQDLDQVPFARPAGTQVGDSWDAVTWASTTGTGTCLEDADASDANQAVCGATTPVNTWVHLAGRWDGTNAALFINGSKVGQRAAPVVELDAHDVMIGTDENMGSPAYEFHGRIDEMQLYSRALTDTEIAGLAH